MPGDRSAVEIHEETGEQWISIRNTWRDYLSPAELAEEVVNLATRHLGLPSLTEVPVGDLDALSYEQMVEFGQLRRELQSLRRHQLEHLHSQVQQDDRIQRRGAHALWRSGRLAGIDLDPEWLEGATAQELSETLTELLNHRPDVEPWKEPAEMTQARRRLEHFWSTV